jgi:hypothetical protein
MTKTWTAMMTRARIHLSPGIEALCFALGFLERGNPLFGGWDRSYMDIAIVSNFCESAIPFGESRRAALWSCRQAIFMTLIGSQSWIFAVLWRHRVDMYVSYYPMPESFSSRSTTHLPRGTSLQCRMKSRSSAPTTVECGESGEVESKMTEATRAYCNNTPVYPDIFQ